VFVVAVALAVALVVAFAVALLACHPRRGPAFCFYVFILTLSEAKGNLVVIVCQKTKDAGIISPRPSFKSNTTIPSLPEPQEHSAVSSKAS
jgi:hypothetical protein